MPLPIPQRLQRSQEFLLACAVALGLALPQPAELLRTVMLPALGGILFFSFLAAPGDIFTRPRLLLHAGLQAVLLSFVLLGGCILGLSQLLFSDPHFRTGYVFLAAAPPASAVFAVTYSLRREADHALRAVLGAYLASLIITPLLILFFLDQRLALEPLAVFGRVALVILLPLAASRAAHGLGWQARLDPIKGKAIKWLFFLVFFILAGVNRGVLLHELLLLWRSALLATGCFLGLGGTVFLLNRKMGAGPARVAVRTLLATCKNTGLAGGLALSLAGARVAAPSVVAVVFMLAFLALMKLYLRRHGRQPA
ncbi:MAG: hypothetical protein KQH53_09510 [Desulfarculaceae bacterium]|nr:hypothetical protein [Desulfarculaceae bacterium]